VERAIDEVDETAEPASGLSTVQHEDVALETVFLESNGYDISEFAAALVDTQAHSIDRPSAAAPFEFHQIVPRENERWVFHKACGEQDLRLLIGIGALLLTLCLGWCRGLLYQHFDKRDLTEKAAINVVAARIIAVESSGDPNAINSRSSATGLGQFLNDTWLDLVREYRPELTKGRAENEILKLRQEAKLARELTERSVEHNAAVLRQRRLPVTAGAIYLAHFAGVAGAAAILSAPDSADAAHVMASADATGRTKPEQLIKANPFLAHFTVADLKTWADRKMQ
jgi:Transglycosylase SLT domain